MGFICLLPRRHGGCWISFPGLSNARRQLQATRNHAEAWIVLTKARWSPAARR